MIDTIANCIEKCGNITFYKRLLYTSMVTVARLWTLRTLGPFVSLVPFNAYLYLHAFVVYEKGLRNAQCYMYIPLRIKAIPDGDSCR